jgi:hypothetical protein
VSDGPRQQQVTFSLAVVGRQLVVMNINTICIAHYYHYHSEEEWSGWYIPRVYLFCVCMCEGEGE